MGKNDTGFISEEEFIEVRIRSRFEMIFGLLDEKKIIDDSNKYGGNTFPIVDITYNNEGWPSTIVYVKDGQQVEGNFDCAQIVLKTVNDDKKVLESVKTLKENMEKQSTLSFGDLDWINKVLAIDLNQTSRGVFSTSDANYIMSFFTNLSSGLQIGIEPGLGDDAIVSEEEPGEGFNWSLVQNKQYIASMIAGEFLVRYNGIVYDIISSFDFRTNTNEEGFSVTYYNNIFIPNTTAETEYMNVAKKRIEDYINNDNYKVTITETEYDFDEKIHASEVFNDIKTNNTVKKIYNLNITKDNKSYDFYFLIKKVDEKDIKVPEVQYLEKENYIRMETTSSDIPANAVIEASKVDNQTRINQVIDYIKTNKLVAFDISLLGNNGYITKINNGTVTIKIPLPEGYVENDTKVYYVSDDGKTGETFEVTYETIEGKRYIVFETDHFSTYVVAKKKKKVL